MSWHVVAAVAERKVGSHARRLLLITMADKANRDGSGIYASVATLARESEITDRTVQRLMKDFQTEGLIKFVGKRPCKGGYTSEYDIDMDVVSALPLLENTATRREQVSGDTVAPVTHGHPQQIVAKPETKSRARGATKSPVTPRRPSGDTMSPKPILEPLSLSSNDERDASPKVRPHSMREDWAPAEPTVAYASKLGFQQWEIEAAAHECREYWLDRPNMKRPGWERTFQRYLRDIVDDRGRRAKLKHVKPDGKVSDAELRRRRMIFDHDGYWQDSWGPKPKKANGHDTERQAA